MATEVAYSFGLYLFLETNEIKINTTMKFRIYQVGVGILLTQIATAGSSYDAAVEFAAGHGTGGTWAFGWSENLSSPLLPYQHEQFSVDIGGGTLSALGVQFDTPAVAIFLPLIAYNPTAKVIQFVGSSQVAYQPHELTLHPGINRQQSVLQWTAPTGGTYGVDLHFEGTDTVGPTTTITIRLGSETLSVGTIAGFGGKFDFTETRNFGAGDKLTVSVGNTQGDYPYYDSTRVVSAKVVSLPALARLDLILNSDFEAISGTDLIHFDRSGHLRDNHHSTFRYLAATNGFPSTNAIPGWTYVGEGGAGTWNVPNSSFPAEASSGANIAWINFSLQTGEIRQTLSQEPLTASQHYRLSAMVGYPLRESWPGYRLELRVGTNLLAQSVSEGSPRHLEAGLFQKVQLDFIAPTNTAELGKALEIVLGSGKAGPSGQVDFDSVQIEVSAAPIADLSLVPDSLIFTNSVSVLVTGAPTNSVIYYTIDGSEPNPTTSSNYVDGIVLTRTCNLRLRAFIESFPVTSTRQAQYARILNFDDGIPNAWRQQFFGLGYMFSEAALTDADPDHDGSSNLREYILGTDPLDKRSGFVAKVGQLPLIQWPAVVGTAYEVERQSLVNGPWLLWRRIVADRDPMTVVDEENFEGIQFYRARPVR